MTNMHYLLTLGASFGEGSDIMQTIINFAPIVAVIVVFYFFLIRPQQKKDKEDRIMRENLEIGDEVVTIGGIIGLVVSVKDDTVVLETGSDRSKIRFLKSAISQNLTAKERASEK